MVQLWIENKIFQIRIVSEKENESPGILAKTEVNVELKSDWNQARVYILHKIAKLPRHSFCSNIHDWFYPRLSLVLC